MIAQPEFDEYIKLVKTFYLKVAKGHPNAVKLSRSFMSMIEELSKPETNLRMSRKKSTASITGSVNSNFSKSVKSLKSINNVKSARNDYLFESADFKRVLLFAYLHYVIGNSIEEIFNRIEGKSKLLIEAQEDSKQVADRVKWERCVKEWKKIMQLLVHKAKVRWEKILYNAISGLEKDFLEVALKSIQSNSNAPTLSSSPNKPVDIVSLCEQIPQNLEQIAAQLKITIVLFEYGKGEILAKRQYGKEKYSLKIGYLKTDAMYAYYEKLPENRTEDTRTEANNKTQHQNFLTIENTPRTSSGMQEAKRSGLSSRETSKKEGFMSEAKSQYNTSDNSAKRNSMPGTLTKRKTLKVVENLLKQYQNNSTKLEHLECFIAENDKQAQIKRKLYERSIKFQNS